MPLNPDKLFEWIKVLLLLKLFVTILLVLPEPKSDWINVANILCSLRLAFVTWLRTFKMVIAFSLLLISDFSPHF
ncbi:hypothetical protein [Spiroplasma ixodetis]|uniref:hypothetical protein n=1 Tax=Spiroplasma ixodetis TaxID=2141 RepID=UPI0025788FE7|nr:hypothetical protein [Spiroplasma ixodetis]